MTRSLLDKCPPASTTRTTFTSESCTDNPDASAALNVARPQGVGGKELRIPKDRAPSYRHSAGKFTTRKQTPQGGSVEASNLHGVTSADRPSCPSEATLPRG